jgi:tRNA pseudouridine38-40 synthase
MYDGTNYCGWQTQPANPTVQGLLETVLRLKLKESLRLVGAGRTDAGVHARGQAPPRPAPTHHSPRPPRCAGE